MFANVESSIGCLLSLPAVVGEVFRSLDATPFLFPSSHVRATPTRRGGWLVSIS